MQFPVRETSRIKKLYHDLSILNDNDMVLLLSPKYMSSKFSGFLVALKNEMPYFRAFPAFFHYSSSIVAGGLPVQS
jgi:hypothetical protein